MTSRKTVWARSDTSLKTLREELLNGESFYKIVHASIGYKPLAPELFVSAFEAGLNATAVLEVV